MGDKISKAGKVGRSIPEESVAARFGEELAVDIAEMRRGVQYKSADLSEGLVPSFLNPGKYVPAEIRAEQRALVNHLKDPYVVYKLTRDVDYVKSALGYTASSPQQLQLAQIGLDRLSRYGPEFAESASRLNLWSTVSISPDQRAARARSIIEFLGDVYVSAISP